MVYLLASLVTASLFGIFSYALSAPAGTAGNPGVDSVFWAILALGATLAVFEKSLHCHFCTLRAVLSRGLSTCRSGVPCRAE